MQYINVGVKRNLQRSIYSSQRGHGRQKIRRGNDIWSIGKEQEKKEQLRYEISIEHITTQKAM